MGIGTVNFVQGSLCPSLYLCLSKSLLVGCENACFGQPLAFTGRYIGTGGRLHIDSCRVSVCLEMFGSTLGRLGRRERVI